MSAKLGQNERPSQPDSDLAFLEMAPIRLKRLNRHLEYLEQSFPNETSFYNENTQKTPEFKNLRNELIESSNIFKMKCKKINELLYFPAEQVANGTQQNLLKKQWDALRDEINKKRTSLEMLCTKLPSNASEMNEYLQSNFTEINSCFDGGLRVTRDDLIHDARLTLLDIFLSQEVAHYYKKAPTLPSCFICYSWGIATQMQRVREIASRLKKAEIDVQLDIWNNSVGSVEEFTNSLIKTNYVLVMGTEDLVAKWKNYRSDGASECKSGQEYRANVVAQELELIQQKRINEKLFGNSGGNVIKVVISGDMYEKSFPCDAKPTQESKEKFCNLHGLTGVDLSKDTNYCEMLFELLEKLSLEPSDEGRKKHKEEIDKFRTSFTRRRRRLEGMSDKELTAYIRDHLIFIGDIGSKIFSEQIAINLSHHEIDLRFYLQPKAIAALSDKMTLDELMAQLNALQEIEALPTTPMTASSSTSSTSTITETKFERKEQKNEPVPGSSSTTTVSSLPSDVSDVRTVIDTFLKNEENLLLLLGEAGSGKSVSTWDITRYLLEQFQPNMSEKQINECWLPIHIYLNEFNLNNLSGLIDYQLKAYGLNDDEINKLKFPKAGQNAEPNVLLILDGYDELRQDTQSKRQDPTNLFKHIGGNNNWDKGRLKVLVTCRRRYITDLSEERRVFGVGRDRDYKRFELLPFTIKQIKAYIKKRHETTNKESKLLKPPDDYIKVIEESESLQKLVSNPFVLYLFLETLPSLEQTGQDTRHITRFDLYTAFISKWIRREVERLNINGSNKLILELGRENEEALIKDFKRLAHYVALSMYSNKTTIVTFINPQEPTPESSVWFTVLEQFGQETNQEYQALEAQNSKSAERFFGLNYAPEKTAFMQQALARVKQLPNILPLRKNGKFQEFAHRSLYEYLVAAAIVDLPNNDPTFEAAVLRFLKQRLIQTEPAVVNFLAELASQPKTTDQQNYTRLRPKLFEIIQRSAKETTLGQASSNAATILNACHEPLSYLINEKSWAGVQLPGADLSYCVLAYSDLRGANLQGAILAHTVFYYTDLRNADLRNVKWGEFPYLKLNTPLTTSVVAWHPTKPIIAIAQNKEIIQMSRETGERVGATFIGHEESVKSIAYSSDGSYLASGSYDRTVRVWNSETSQPLGEPLWGHTDVVVSVAFSPDSKQVISGSHDNHVRLWDIGSRENAPFTGHTEKVSSVAFSPNGCHFASGGQDKTVRLWNTQTGKPGKVLTHAAEVTSIAFSPDGRRLASGDAGGAIHLWDTETGQPAGKPLRGHMRVVTSIAFSPKGYRLASGSDDQTVQLWDIETGQPTGLPFCGHTSAVRSVVFSSDGKQIASSSWDNTLRLWDAERELTLGLPIRGHMSSVQSTAFSSDGRRLASASGTMLLWNIEHGIAVGAPTKEPILCVAFCGSGGLRLVSGGSDGTVQLWNAITGQPVGAPLQGHTKLVTSIALSPNGLRLASGSADHTVQLWNAETGQPIGKPLCKHTNWVRSVAFSHDNKLLASGGEAVRIWDAKTGQHIRILNADREQSAHSFCGYVGMVRSVAFSHNDKRLAVGGSDGIQLWDAETGRPLDWQLLKFQADIISVAFSPDSRRLVSGSGDGTVRLWDLAKQHCLATLQWHQPVYSVALVASPHSSSTNAVPSAEPKALTTFSTKAVEDWLAVGDETGAISFWAISVEHPEKGFRLMDMPKHSGMPLLAQGAVLQGCKMDAMSKRLLEQHGWDSRQVGVNNVNVVLDSKHSLPAVTPAAATTKLNNNSAAFFQPAAWSLSEEEETDLINSLMTKG